MARLDTVYTKPVRQALLLVQLVLLCVPKWMLFVIQTDNGLIPASLCYFFSLVFAPYLLRCLFRPRRLRLPPWWLTALILFTALLALVRMSQYGLSKGILHWAFGAYLLTVILNTGADFLWEDWRRLLETAACVFAVLQFALILTDLDTVWWLLSGYFTGERMGGSATWLPSLTRGGVNLDCAWLAMFGFFVGGRKKAVYATYVLLFSFFCCSRVGVIAAGMLFLWTLLYDPIYRLTGKNLKWWLLYAAAVLFLLFASGIGQALMGKLLITVPPPGRLFGFQNDRAEQYYQNLLAHTGSTGAVLLNGRAAIWEKIPAALAQNPWGYGAGNAMRILRQYYGFDMGSDVVHCVFLQWLMDEGIPGGLAYIALVAGFLRRQWKRRPYFFRQPLDAFLATYLVLSLVQFHGAEALMVYVLGVFLLHLDSEKAIPAPQGAAKQ